ncbi:MFS-type transporter SLC18B1 [Elysia marginata]|uniref:MFS-type transporter SLC18B1 n=1 Tax=Elysia marginata TaxID=1093978 RepID=A0AAV4FSU7_9GAST|nr:MFS-type transporter SLC18B1 [Elysia marginata]
MSLMVRTVEAMGISAFETSSFAIISAEFPDHIASAFSILETCQGIGYMTGATVGGLLYAVGGFGFPFWTTGVLVLSTGILFLACLPPPTEGSRRRQGNILTLLRSPMVWIAILLIVAGSSAIGFLNPTITLHLKLYGLSTLEASLFFIIAPVLYALLSPLWGYLNDSKDIQAPLMMWACIACGGGFLMIGPTPVLPFLPKQLWIITVGYVLFGLGIGCTVIPTMKCMVIGARELGFPDNISTFGMVSGLFNANFHFG